MGFRKSSAKPKTGPPPPVEDEESPTVRMRNLGYTYATSETRHPKKKEDKHTILRRIYKHGHALPRPTRHVARRPCACARPCSAAAAAAARRHKQRARGHRMYARAPSSDSLLTRAPAHLSAASRAW